MRAVVKGAFIMSGTVRAGLLFGLAALFASVGGLFLPIPCVNFVLSIGSVIALGWGAGYTAAKTTNATSDQRLGRGVTAGAIGGTILLIGTVVSLLLLSGLLLNLPEFRSALDQVVAQNPEASGQVNPDDLGAVLGLGSAVVGFCLGAFNFLLMLLGGLFGGLSWKAPAVAGYGPMGGTPYAPQSGGYIPSQTNNPNYTQPSGGYIPSQTNDPPYNQPGNAEGGARIYDPNDPNRPQ